MIASSRKIIIFFEIKLCFEISFLCLDRMSSLEFSSWSISWRFLTGSIFLVTEFSSRSRLTSSFCLVRNLLTFNVLNFETFLQIWLLNRLKYSILLDFRSTFKGFVLRTTRKIGSFKFQNSKSSLFHPNLADEILAAHFAFGDLLASSWILLKLKISVHQWTIIDTIDIFRYDI